MKILSLNSSSKNNSLNINKPSFKSEIIVSDGAQKMIMEKLPDLFSRCSEQERRNLFGEGPIDIFQKVSDFKNAFLNRTKNVKGMLLIKTDPESEEFLRVIYQYPDERILTIGSISPHEILPNETLDGGIPFSYKINNLVKSISDAIAFDGTQCNKNGFFELSQNIEKRENLLA